MANLDGWRGAYRSKLERTVFLLSLYTKNVLTGAGVVESDFCLTAFSKGSVMARIQEREIERLKKDVSLERLVEARGVKLRRHGKDLIGLCPFHGDREPSLVVTPETNLWHCLGACQSGGSVIDWVMKSDGLSFRHAVELLRDGAVSSSLRASASAPSTKAKGARLSALFAADSEDDAVLSRVVDFYHRTLFESPEAMGYLEKRGLGDEEMIRHFKIGFSNRTLGYRLPEKWKPEGAELRGRLQKIGVLRDSGHEHFTGSIVVPIFDNAPAGEQRVVGMYGRKITPHLREGTPLHTYLPGPHRGVWNSAALASAPHGVDETKEVILCEAIIDALTFWSAGFRNVITSYGVRRHVGAVRLVLHQA